MVIDGGRLAVKITEALEQADILAAPGGKHATLTVRAEGVPFAGGSADAIEIGVKLRLHLILRPEGGAPAHFADELAAVGQAPLDPHDAAGAEVALQHLAERTATDLLRGYITRQKLWVGDQNTLKAALAGADNDVRIEAIRIVAARQLREHVPKLIELLGDEEEGVRDAALGALVTLHERSAVKVLAESRHMRDAREMRKVLDAIATLGGREAQEYLAFVAETHDDDEIRDMAKAALDHMTRRASQNQPTR